MFQELSKILCKQKFKILLVILLMLLCLTIYWIIIDPIASFLYIPKDAEFAGTSYYEDGTYLDLECGELFNQILSRYNALDQKAVDFYYFDTYFQDNPIYGKSSDLYALEIIVEQDEFIELKDEVSSIAEPYCQIGNHMLYAMIEPLGGGRDVTIVSFCEKTKTIRYILITDYGDTVSFCEVTLLKYSYLNWH